MATPLGDNGICFRVPRSFRRRIDRLGEIQLKSISEMAREAFREYAARREVELGLPPAKNGNGKAMVAVGLKFQPYQFLDKDRELKICGLCAREQRVNLSAQEREDSSICPKHARSELRKVGK